MTVEIAALAGIGAGGAATGAAGAAAGGAPVQVGYGVSLSDFGNFQQSLARLETQPVQGPSEAARQFMRPFEYINNEAARINDTAQAAKADGKEMTPGEMVSMTVRCQEFMFHCQLVSNIANRTSDGIQQLFRQQS